MEEKIKKVGGQAVIEGVMMASSKFMAVSVRNKDKIITKKVKFKKTPALFKKPFIRGIFNLINMLVIGMKSLLWSAEVSVEETGEKISKYEWIISLLISFLFVVVFFVGLPFLISSLFTESRGVFFNLIDGLIRVLLFVSYVVFISLMKDVRRVFQYHGAEHKTVHCYEAKKPLTVTNVKKYTTLHSRCGTSFIVFVLILSILVFSLIPKSAWYINILFRILLIPVIAGLSYEFLKFSDKYKNNIIIRLLSRPGLWLQKLTTREPDSKQIEVAIKSLKEVLKLEKVKC